MSATEEATADVGEAFRPPADVLPSWLPVRQRNRLDPEAYREPGSFFVTISAAGRRPWFRRAPVVAECTSQLRAACEREGFELEAYCFMPDHLHLLATSEVEHDLGRLVHGFKQRTGYWFRNRYLAGGLKASPTAPDERPSLWQKSYYDHVLRREDDIDQVIQYIVENPVRAGLAGCVEEYPYAWSACGLPGPA
ncbi:MAG: transposase [Dehalococcoidia bacterium]